MNHNDLTAVNTNADTINREHSANHPTLYHYTAGWEKIAAILATEIISKETQLYEGHVLVTWFSANPVWENSIMKVDGGLENHAKKLGAFRLKVNRIPAHPWSEFRKKSGEMSAICDALEKVGHQHGADPADWYCSIYHIPLCEATIESVGIYRNGKWEDLPVKEFKKKYAKELAKVKITPVTVAQINKLLKKGYALSPVLIDSLKRIAESGHGEGLSVATIGKIIHLIPVAVVK